MRIQRAFLIAFFCLFAAAGFGQVRFRKLPQETISSRLEAAPANQKERWEWLHKQFEASGCTGDNLKDDVVSHEKQPNVICTLPDTTDKIIVVGAHYDFIERGRGIVDNWSGASLLPSLYESLSTEKREHTFVFIAFTGEEEGLVGSRSYVKHLTKEQRAAVTAMINLDTLGLGPTKVWASGSSKPLVNALINVSKMLNSPLGIVNVDNVGTSDNQSFRDAKIEEICIHSVTQDTLGILHSSRDQLSAIKLPDYYESYRLLTGYIAILDNVLDKSAPKTAAGVK